MTASVDTVAAIIVAAGRGERAGGPEHAPKQYRTIGGRSVIDRALSSFLAHPSVGRIVVVIHADDRGLLGDATNAERPDIVVALGGSTRQESVFRGLEVLAADPPECVLIHDAARPFVAPALLNGVIAELARGETGVIPALPVSDTLKAVGAGGYIEATVPRAGLHAAQTPQGFAFGAIYEAHRQARNAAGENFTDDASIAEWAGIPVKIIGGSPANVKLTLKDDLELAEARLSHDPHCPDVRTGNGYDVHALVPGDGVTLCGVRIPHDRSLSGHSDADVGYHALTDALLATCAAGDIGDHFPPSDPQWRGKPSSIFLSHAARMVREAGGVVTCADVSLIAESPKVGPHREAMRRKMADDLGIDMARCSVKATTNERIGFVGRGEGIAAIATATVIYPKAER